MTGQQFFNHLPSSATRSGPRRFTSVDRLIAAWRGLPRDWHEPFDEADRDGGHQWDATPPGAREPYPTDEGGGPG